MKPSCIVICYFIVKWFLVLLFVQCVFSEDRDWNEKFKNSLQHFDNKYFQASSNELSAKAQRFLNQTSISFVISPLLLELVLMFISLGSSNKTLDELKNVIMLDMNNEDEENVIDEMFKKVNKSDKDTRLEVSNMMFIDKGSELTQHFEKISQNIFNTTVYSVDYGNISSCITELNNLVKQKTKRKMKDIFEASDFTNEEPSIIFVNNIYFKAKFLYPPTVLNDSYPFRRGDRRKENFTEVKMHRISGYMLYGDISQLNSEVVEIPYMSPNLSILIILPKEIDELLSVEEKLMKNDNIIQYFDGKLKNTSVAITLPKFSIEGIVLLPSKIQAMGAKKLFTEEAELKIISSSKQHISHAIQRIKFWGDQARGAFKDTGDEEFPKPEIKLFGDHPFFFIVKMSDLPLMMGHLLV